MKEQTPIRFLALIVVALFLLIMGLTLVCSTARAEWVTIREFGGLDGVHSRTSIPWSQGGRVNAFQCHNWLPERGALCYPRWGWRNARPTNTTFGTPYMIQTMDPNKLLFRSAYMYNVALDSTEGLFSDTVNSISTVSGDSLVANASGGAHRWLELVLTNISSVVIQGSPYKIHGFFTDDSLRLATGAANTASCTLFVANVPLSNDIGSVDGFVGANGTVDTLWLTDGSNLIFFDTSLTAQSITYPSYDDIVTADSARFYRTGTSGDSICVYGNFTNAANGDLVLLNYSFGNDGHPFWQYGNIIGNGAADERIKILGDAAWYAKFGQDTVLTSIRCVVVTPNAFDFVGNYQGNYVYDSNKTVSGSQKIHFAHFTPFDQTVFESNRDWDSKVYKIFTTGAQWYGRTEKSGSSVAVYMWTATPGSSPWTAGVNNASFAVHKMRPFTATNTNTKANEYRGVEERRGIAYYFRSTADKRKFSYSAVYDYDSINTLGDRVSFDITAGMILGDELCLYGRNNVIYVSPIGDDAFNNGVSFRQGAGNVGAPCQGVIAEDPTTNAHYFVNPEGFWSNDGASVQRIPTLADNLWTDSIAWWRESEFDAVVYQGKYILSCYIGLYATAYSSAVLAPCLVSVDLETYDVSRLIGGAGKPCPSRLYVWKGQNSRDRLFAGTADSTAIYEMDPDIQWNVADSTAIRDHDIKDVAQWQTGFDDFGDRTAIKTVTAYRITYEITQNYFWMADCIFNNCYDTIIVSFYGEPLSEKFPDLFFATDTVPTLRSVGGDQYTTILYNTAATSPFWWGRIWADTVVFSWTYSNSSAIYQWADIEGVFSELHKNVANEVWGHSLSVGIESRSKRVKILELSVNVEPTDLDVRSR